MRQSRLNTLLFVAVCVTVAGCGESSTNRSRPSSNDIGSNESAKQKQNNGKQTAKDLTKTNFDNQPPVKFVDSRPLFDEKEMIQPLTAFRGYSLGDYAKLPNCLDLFKDCLLVEYKGKTSEQYKSALLEVAQRPCRMILKVVDVPADYDYAQFELVTDDGESGMMVLKQGGDLGNYTKHLREVFSINDAKKKGLDSKRRSIGDRVVLVGLGYVVSASPWGASSPRYGMPSGDERKVMLRAFGKPNNYHPNDYEFSFMIRNWYIASQ